MTLSVTSVSLAGSFAAQTRCPRCGGVATVAYGRVMIGHKRWCQRPLEIKIRGEMRREGQR